MNIAISGCDVVIDDEMKQKIENKFSKLNKYLVFDEPMNVNLNVKTFRGNALKVEIGVLSKFGLLRSEVVHDDFFSAVDLAVDILIDQIKKQRGRLSRHHKDLLTEDFFFENNEEEIPVRTKNIVPDELSLDEAILRMEMLSHSFFIYKDTDSKKLAVIYKQRKGGYGLIEIL